MAFIRVQKLVKDKDGNINSGSAVIVDVEYVKNEKYHSKQTYRERLGKILYLAEDNKSGIFLSPTRGLVEYDVTTNIFTEVKIDDERIAKKLKSQEPSVHTVFGDTYLLLELLKKSGLLSVLREVFSNDSDYEREICHLLHSILKDGSRIGCDDFIQKSFVSQILQNTMISTLYSDTRYFTLLGDERTREAFFKAFVKMMRKKHPGFGHGCYVDSTPLPNSIVDNPFNALCNHGTGCNEEQMRLILVLDQETGLPIWYDVIPGNVLDLSTIKQVLETVEATLDVEISELILDAGYASRDLFKAYARRDMRAVICRMPHKKGYPYATLYRKNKQLIGKAKYTFIHHNHTYFGKKEIIDLFDEKYFAYVFVDMDNALVRAREYMLKHPDKYEKMTNQEKDWRSVCGGFFILISTWDNEPKTILEEYFNRTRIEDVFKTSKDYLQLLPINKWTSTTVKGKLLADIIHTIGYLQIQSKLTKTEISFPKMIGRTQSLMCVKSKNAYVLVETPNKQVKEIYQELKVDLPAHVNLPIFREEILMEKCSVKSAQTYGCNTQKLEHKKQS